MGPGKTRLKLYTLFRAEGPKTIPYPAARPRIAHIGEYPLGSQMSVSRKAEKCKISSSRLVKSELPVGWPSFVVFCRYMEYFKKLTLYPLLTYLGLQTDKVWAKSIFWPWPHVLNFPRFLLTFTLKQSITKYMWTGLSNENAITDSDLNHQIRLFSVSFHHESVKDVQQDRKKTWKFTVPVLQFWNNPPIDESGKKLADSLFSTIETVDKVWEVLAALKNTIQICCCFLFDKVE